MSHTLCKQVGLSHINIVNEVKTDVRAKHADNGTTDQDRHKRLTSSFYSALEERIKKMFLSIVTFYEYQARLERAGN